MPPGNRPPTPSDIYRLAFSGTVGGQPFANIFHVKGDNSIDSQAGMNDLVDAVASAAASSNPWSQFSNTVHVTQLQIVQQLDANTARKGQKSLTINGAVATAPLGAQAAVVLSWLSGAYWRGGKPRTYMPGVPATMIDTNHSLSDTLKADVISAAAGFRTAINAIKTPALDLLTLGVVSYASNKQWRTTPLFLGFTGVTVHDRLASQRRRLGPWLP